MTLRPRASISAIFERRIRARRRARPAPRARPAALATRCAASAVSACVQRRARASTALLRGRDLAGDALGGCRGLAPARRLPAISRRPRRARRAPARCARGSAPAPATSLACSICASWCAFWRARSPRPPSLQRRAARRTAALRTRVQVVDRAARRRRRAPQPRFQLLDLGLPREQPGISPIGRVEADRMAGVNWWPSRFDQQRAGRQRVARRRLRQLLRRRHTPAQPVGAARRRPPRRRHGSSSQRRRSPARWRVATPRRRGRRRSPARAAHLPARPASRPVGELERMQALAQHRLHRRLPAGVDAQLLPQPRARLQALALEPVAQRRVLVGSPGLDLAQGGELRLGARHARVAAAPSASAAAALALFETRRYAASATREARLRRVDRLLQARRCRFAAPAQRAGVGLGERLQLARRAARGAARSACAAALEVREVRLLELQAALGLLSWLPPARASAQRFCAARNACSTCGSAPAAPGPHAARRRAVARRRESACRSWPARAVESLRSRHGASCARRSVCWLSRRCASPRRAPQLGLELAPPRRWRRQSAALRRVQRVARA